MRKTVNYTIVLVCTFCVIVSGSSCTPKKGDVKENRSTAEAKHTPALPSVRTIETTSTPKTTYAPGGWAETETRASQTPAEMMVQVIEEAVVRDANEPHPATSVATAKDATSNVTEAMTLNVNRSSLTPTVAAMNAVTRNVVIVTWNVRGYPETRQSDKEWFTAELDRLSPDVLCIQEIANAAKVNSFMLNEKHCASVAFCDSRDGQDNAIFASDLMMVEDMPDPIGCQHPPQAAYVTYEGFDAVVVTVHLSWTNVTMREKEKVLLKDVVTEMLRKDPDVIICGDFNTTERGIAELAKALGMTVMVPAGQQGVGTTYAGNRYDHFLISADLANEEAVSCRIVTFSGSDVTTGRRVSDHLPVAAVFRSDSVFRDRN